MAQVLDIPPPIDEIPIKDICFTIEAPDLRKPNDSLVPSCGGPDDLRVNRPALYKVPVIPTSCSFGVVEEKPEATVPLQAMTKKERRLVRANVTVVFAVRRPGCGSCREHAMQLAELAETEEKVCVIGVVKETEQNHEALLEFYEDYFRRPIYRDQKWQIYDALGNRKLSLMKVFTTTPKLLRRWNNKKIKTAKTSEDGLTQGGVMVFDKRGELRFVYQETYGEELDLERLREAINDARRHAGSGDSFSEASSVSGWY